MDKVFVLLDDCHATEQQPTSRLYSDFVREHRCTEPDSLDELWQDVTLDQQAGLHVVVFADYEWGAKLQQAGLQQVMANDSSALRVLMFKSLQRLGAEAVSQWLEQQDGSRTATPAGICALQASANQARFNQDIARIHALISQGETYQINYTFHIQGAQYGTPWGLYRRLREMQPVAFGALACLPDCGPETATNPPCWVLSSSPELFVRNTCGLLTTRPMKGTAARLPDPQQDQQQALWLSRDAKNRAENVMIVDLLRNDLGRISRTGSVRVTSLFAVESYTTVHQMTSTVESHMKDDVDLPAVLRALFPCGSITGAPKLHSMDLIARLEGAPRGLYCGTLGWIDAPTAQSSAGDFCLSVAIRTIVLGAAQRGLRNAQLGVGSGIVQDSEAADEYAETRAKTHYLTAMDPGFTLFETMRVSRGRIRHLVWHLQRLQASAQALGFACDLVAARSHLGHHLHSLDATQQYRLRLDLGHDGSINLQHSVLTSPASGPALLMLAEAPVPAHEATLLKHKTSLRTTYDAAIQQAKMHSAFDVVFFNLEGDMTEGARSSIFVKLQGCWWTPPLSSGALAGVMRQRVLQRYPHIGEKQLPLEDALGAQQLMLCSALRGIQHAQWMRNINGEVLRLGLTAD